ncbi:Mediator of RNA polymerase II transcription subunit 9, partial [Lemmus lemmus]
KEEISFLLAYNIIKHIQKNNPSAHQDLNDYKIQFQVTRAHKGTMCGIHVSPEQQLLLPNLQGQARPKKGLMQKYNHLCMVEIPKEWGHLPGGSIP